MYSFDTFSCFKYFTVHQSIQSNHHICYIANLDMEALNGDAKVEKLKTSIYDSI